MNEFVVEIKTPAQLTGNFEAVKTGLTEMMKAYEGLEVTEENIPERKKDVATLRKIKAAIDDRRKAIKKEYDKPYKEFDGKCKELTGIIDSTVSELNKGLDFYEQKRVMAKRERIARLYAENIGDYGEYLPLQAIAEERWVNKTVTEKEITDTIQTAVLAVKQALDVINSTMTEFADECRKAYKRNLDIADAMRRYNDLQTAKQIAQEAVKKENAAPVEVIPQEPEPQIIPLPVPEVPCYRFTVHSKEDADSVRAYLEMFGIRYEEG